jgi:hypothetical protein
MCIPRERDGIGEFCVDYAIAVRQPTGALSDPVRVYISYVLEKIAADDGHTRAELRGIAQLINRVLTIQ